MKTTKVITIFLILVALMLTAKAALGAVYINEVLADPEGTDSGNEWVELYSDSDEEVNLTGWYINDSDSEGDFLSGILNEEDQYIVISDVGFSLINNEETLELYNKEGELQDTLTYPDATAVFHSVDHLTELRILKNYPH